jgi:hypothetical protein
MGFRSGAMASEEKIKARILGIAVKPKNVTLADIEWVMNQLKQFGEVVVSENVHRKVWCFDGALFSVCPHHKGNKQLKPAYVKDFLNAMIKTGWYE